VRAGAVGIDDALDDGCGAVLVREPVGARRSSGEQPTRSATPMPRHVAVE